jgi:hypothetical protein
MHNQPYLLSIGERFMTLKNTLLAATALVAVSVSFAEAAKAADALIGLVDGTSIVTIDPATRAVTSTVKLDSDELVGIDIRPSDNKLYGLTDEGALVTIDVKTGKTTQVSKVPDDIDEDDVTVVDFNPAADRLRVLDSGNNSYRINVMDGKTTIDGKLAFKKGDANEGKTPSIIAAAYTNSSKDAKETKLYNIDSETGSLVLQDPPNDGTLNTVGALGITLESAAAFNIVHQEGNNQAWLVNGTKLYEVNLETGKATEAGELTGLDGDLTDIAWWHAAK